MVFNYNFIISNMQKYLSISVFCFLNACSQTDAQFDIFSSTISSYVVGLDDVSGLSKRCL